MWVCRDNAHLKPGVGEVVRVRVDDGLLVVALLHEVKLVQNFGPAGGIGIVSIIGLDEDQAVDRGTTALSSNLMNYIVIIIFRLLAYGAVWDLEYF